MGRFGRVTLRFRRGVRMEEKYQKLTRSGGAVRRVSRRVMSQPRCKKRERRGGVLRRVKRARFENPSAPGPSAGRTPSLMEGDCDVSQMAIK